MEIALLGSGSRGNSVLVRSGDSSFLVDAGLSAREITARLALKGISPNDLQGVVLTHEHSDHIRGVGPLARRFNLP
ncbi:MAG: MBL fold metallo-hydrolase, partial [Nitrospinaceae bacterium]|nr:MBL fold metallo-hydrolase [Nitrospinaceae bacterium]